MRSGRSTFVAAASAVVVSGCPSLAGINQDYTSGGGSDASRAPDGGRSPLDARDARDARTSADSRTTMDVSVDARRTSGDAAPDSGPTDGRVVHMDAVVASDAPEGDACTSGCGCPMGETMCGASCVNTSTDMNNCGGCSTACSAPSPSTATCALARCVVTLAAEAGYGAGITVDATSVYWSNGGGLLKVPLRGGSVTTLVVDGNQPFQVAVNASDLYWTGFLGILARVSLDGSSSSTLVTTGLPTPPPYFLALDSANVYYTTQTDTTTGTVVALALSGSSSLSLGTGQDLTAGIAVSGGQVYWASAGTSSANTGSISASATGAVGITGIATAQETPYAVATDGTNVYWTNREMPGLVMQVPVTGGTAVTLASNRDIPTGIATDGANVYWNDQDGDVVMKVPIGGGTPVTVASISAPQFLAVDGTSVYVTTSDAAGHVFRITPK